jgi:hypothetical protein
MRRAIPLSHDTRILCCVPNMVINMLADNICITFSEMLLKVYNIGFFNITQKGMKLKSMFSLFWLKSERRSASITIFIKQIRTFLPIRNTAVL